MKRGTPRHPKVTRLAEELAIETFAAVGLLELLWHFTAEFSPAGDIGRHSNKAIAAALYWRKHPDKLVGALAASGWVENVEPPQRLIVHDWQEHCEDSVHMKIARAKGAFWDGSSPKIGRLPAKERDLAKEFYAHAVRTESAQDAHYGLGLAKALIETKKEIPSEALSSFEPFFDRLYAIHPNKAGKILAQQALSQLVSQSVDPVEIMRKLEHSHESWLPHFQRENGKFAPRLDRWIESSGFMDDPPQRAQTEAERIALL